MNSRAGSAQSTKQRLQSAKTRLTPSKHVCEHRLCEAGSSKPASEIPAQGSLMHSVLSPPRSTVSMQNTCLTINNNQSPCMGRTHVRHRALHSVMLPGWHNEIEIASCQVKWLLEHSRIALIPLGASYFLHNYHLCSACGTPCRTSSRRAGPVANPSACRRHNALRSSPWQCYGVMIILS